MLTLPGAELLRARRAVAGIEFAIILPMLLTLLGGLADLSMYFITARQVSTAAEEVALVASTMAVQAATSNKLTGQQAWQATTAPFAIFPSWRNANDFAITLSGVSFTATKACTSACSYTGTLAWSVGNPAGQIKLRPCGKVAVLPDGSGGSMAGLPASVIGATSVLVADVSTPWVPPLGGVFSGTVTLLRSAYVSPRSGNGIALISIGPGTTVLCAAS